MYIYTFDGYFTEDSVQFIESTPVYKDITLYTERIDHLILVNAEASAVAAKLNGNMNNLTITVTETYSDGSMIEIIEILSVDNNIADTYEVGNYNIYVDIKGNNQVRACYII